MNPRDCDQSAFGQIRVEKHGEKITVNSVPREGEKFAIHLCQIIKYNRTEWNVLISLLYNHTAEIF
jgi:hypothetical protein